MRSQTRTMTTIGNNPTIYVSIYGSTAKGKKGRLRK